MRHLPKPELEPASDAMRPLAHRNERRAGPMAWWRLTCIKPARAFRVSMDTIPFAPHVHGRCGSPIPEETSMRSRPFVVLLAWLALLVGQVAPAAANDLTRSVTSGDIAVNFGVVPANQTAAAGGSAADASSNVNLYLLTVALFDRSTGKRIENAHITAVVKGPRSEASSFHTKPKQMQLEPARDGNAVTYGHVFDARWKGIYHIDLAITRDGSTHVEHVRLNYDQQF
ncbi:hypothetical protein MYA_5656 [Burkholderia sp. KJ006]|nr:hypothetical protein MYA_5656 [Burkholderia sp. KJ006]